MSAPKRRPIRRNDQPGSSSIAGALKRVEKPKCPMHEQEAQYDPSDGYWHCPEQGCRIVFRQKGDHVLASSGNYKGPVSIVHDRRDGKVWLRLAASSDTGSAPMVLLMEGGDALGGISAVSGTPRVWSSTVSDVATIDHSGRVIR